MALLLIHGLAKAVDKNDRLTVGMDLDDKRDYHYHRMTLPEYKTHRCNLIAQKRIAEIEKERPAVAAHITRLPGAWTKKQAEAQEKYENLDHEQAMLQKLSPENVGEYWEWKHGKPLEPYRFSMAHQEHIARAIKAGKKIPARVIASHSGPAQEYFKRVAGGVEKAIDKRDKFTAAMDLYAPEPEPARSSPSPSYEQAALNNRDALSELKRRHMEEYHGIPEKPALVEPIGHSYRPGNLARPGEHEFLFQHGNTRYPVKIRGAIYDGHTRQYPVSDKERAKDHEDAKEKAKLAYQEYAHDANLQEWNDARYHETGKHYPLQTLRSSSGLYHELRKRTDIGKSLVCVVWKAIDKKDRFTVGLDFDDATPARGALSSLSPIQQNAVRQLSNQHRAGTLHLKRMVLHPSGVVAVHHFNHDGELHAIHIDRRRGILPGVHPIEKFTGQKSIKTFTDLTFGKKPRYYQVVNRPKRSRELPGQMAMDYEPHRVPEGHIAHTSDGQTLKGGEYMPADAVLEKLPVKQHPTSTETRIEDLLAWSPPREVATRMGPRILRTATPTEDFWNVWKVNKEQLKQAGLGAGRNRYGEWEVTWWQELSEKKKEEKRERIEASRATDTDKKLISPKTVGKSNLDYYGYQKAGIAESLRMKMLGAPGVIIGDEMGLGKTPQSIGISNNDPSVNNVLVVCPASLKINWSREWQTWDTKGMSVGIAEGTSIPNTDVVIINYDILRGNEKKLLQRKWDMTVFDEFHYMANEDSQRTVVALGGEHNYGTKKKPDIVKHPGIQTSFIVALSGTPIVNRPKELWPILHRVDPEGLGRSWYYYHTRYCGAYRGRYGMELGGATNLDELQEKLRLGKDGRGLMIRRLKSQVLTDLPPKTRKVIELETPPEVKKLLAEQNAEWAKVAERTGYDKLEADAKRALEQGNLEEYKAVAGRLEEIEASFEEFSKLGKVLGVAKVPAIIDHVDECLQEVSKVIVFAHHRDVVAKLSAHYGNKAVMVIGGMEGTARQVSVDEFQHNPNVRVFIGSTRAAAEGLTLTAGNMVVMAEMDWTPGKMMQAEDRAHRIGQKKNVLVHYLVYNGSLDAKKLRTAVDKMEIQEAALDTRHSRESHFAPSATAPAETVALKPKTPAVDPNERTVKLTAPAPPAKTWTQEEVDLIVDGLGMLVGMDSDRARVINGAGFNKMDGDFGRSLHSKLAAYGVKATEKQIEAGRKLLVKYRGQMPSDIAEGLSLYGKKLKLSEEAEKAIAQFGETTPHLRANLEDMVTIRPKKFKTDADKLKALSSALAKMGYKSTVDEKGVLTVSERGN